MTTKPQPANVTYPQNAHDAAAIIRQLDPDVILKAAALCGGHNIVDPAAFTAVGLPSDVVDQLVVEHRSDYASPKSTLYVDGQAVDSICGIYGLDMLIFLAGSLGVTYPSRLGRGSEASAIRTALHDHFRNG